MSERTLTLIKDNDIRWVDLRFTDTRGKEQHVSIPASQVDEDFFEDGKMFDGSSIAGWKGINESDMILMPDDSTSIIDPFTDDATVILRCDIVEPSTMQGYERDPRSVAKRAEAYLASTGLGDTAFFGQSQSSSSSMTLNSRWRCKAQATLSTPKRQLGRRTTISRKVIQAIVLASKAATSRCHPLTRCMTLEPPCAQRWSKWVSM